MCLTGHHFITPAWSGKIEQAASTLARKTVLEAERAFESILVNVYEQPDSNIDDRLEELPRSPFGAELLFRWIG